MVTLDSIVRNVMVGKAYKESEYTKYLQYAIRGLRTMNQKMGVPKTIRLILRDNLTAKLPPDFLDYTKIGILAGNEMFTLGYNPDLCVIPTEIEDCEPRTVVEGTDSSRELGFYFYNIDENITLAHNGMLFGAGIPRNPRGEYFVDTRLMQVQFSFAPEGDVFMEYRSNGLEATNGDIWIDELMTEPLIAWVKFCEAEDDPRATEAKIERFRRRHVNASHDLMMSRFSFTFDEFKEAARSSYQLSPKR